MALRYPKLIIDVLRNKKFYINNNVIEECLPAKINFSMLKNLFEEAEPGDPVDHILISSGYASDAKVHWAFQLHQTPGNCGAFYISSIYGHFPSIDFIVCNIMANSGDNVVQGSVRSKNKKELEDLGYHVLDIPSSRKRFVKTSNLLYFTKFLNELQILNPGYPSDKEAELVYPAN